jgi:hypothetical protein
VSFEKPDEIIRRTTMATMTRRHIAILDDEKYEFVIENGQRV